MNQSSNDRRRFLASAGGALAATTLASQAALCTAQQQSAPPSSQVKRTTPMPEFRFCLNMSTINHAKVPVREQIKFAAAAGYDAIEPWLGDIDQFVQEGGSIPDLKKEISDLGLGVDSAIAFGNWIVDDEAQRTAGLEQCKKDMETVRGIGGHRIAAPPVGATKEPGLDLKAAGERYHALLELGRSYEVVPQVELWGFSKNLSTLAEVLFVAAAANHPDACVLLDIYHLYKGGSDFNNIGLIPGAKMHCLHMNDYPAVPNRAEIGDKDRVYPGDGIAPLNQILKTLAAGGFKGTLSLELFNRSYWEQPPAEVATTGLAKMKATVAAAFS